MENAVQQLTISRRLSFFDLPVEVRGIIYKHLFSTTIITCRVRGSAGMRYPVHAIINILLASRRSHLEAKPYFWKHCQFDLATHLEMNAIVETDTRRMRGAEQGTLRHIYSPLRSRFMTVNFNEIGFLESDFLDPELLDDDLSDTDFRDFDGDGDGDGDNIGRGGINFEDVDNTPKTWYIRTEQLHQIQRIYCTSKFARCLHPAFKKLPGWVRRIFPGMDPKTMQVNEMTMEMEMNVSHDRALLGWGVEDALSVSRQSFTDTIFIRAMKERDMRCLRKVRVLDSRGIQFENEIIANAAQPRREFTINNRCKVVGFRHMKSEDAQRYKKLLDQMLFFNDASIDKHLEAQYDYFRYEYRA